MSKRKKITHTAGPWEASALCSIYATYGGEHVATLELPEVTDREQHVVNVRLMAAAPELLVALEAARPVVAAVLEMAGKLQVPLETCPELAEIVAWIDRAINKATKPFAERLQIGAAASRKEASGE